MSDAYGIHVFMRLDQTFDGWPIYILYAHFSQVLVETGQHVERGELIGLAGATGFTTGPHVHHGPNWNGDLVGREIDPFELREEIEERMPSELVAQHDAKYNELTKNT